MSGGCCLLHSTRLADNIYFRFHCILNLDYLVNCVDHWELEYFHLYMKHRSLMISSACIFADASKKKTKFVCNSKRLVWPPMYWILFVWQTTVNHTTRWEEIFFFIVFFFRFNSFPFLIYRRRWRRPRAVTSTLIATQLGSRMFYFLRCMFTRTFRHFMVAHIK